MSYDFRGPNSVAGDSASSARLEVEVPHWAAIIRIYNNLHQLVWECNNPQFISESPPVYVAQATLPPGIYQVEATLEDRAERKVVSVRPGRPKKIKWGEWKSLKVASSAPRASTVTSNDAHTAAALEWSRQETWKAGGGDSRLFIFVRTAKPGRHTSFSDGLHLLDASGNTLTSFSDSAEKNAEAGWMAFNALLPSACYVLKRERTDEALHYIPLYLSAGWETQIFLPARNAPSLRALTLNLAPYGSGYRPDEEEALAADTVLESLRSGMRGRHLVDNSKLTVMLRKKFKNPWLGILAAHLLLRSGAQDPLAAANREADSELSDLFQEVMENLSNMPGMSDHPDIRALQLKSDEPALKPFSHPPLLQVGLQRVQSHSVVFADTVPYRSLTDCVIDNILANSVWTSWRSFDRVPLTWHDTPAPTIQTTSRSRRATQTSATEFFVSSVTQGQATTAPVYRFTHARKVAGDESQGETSRQDQRAINPLFTAAFIQKITEITNKGDLSGLPEIINLNVSKVVDNLLDSIQPEEISRTLDLPLSRVEHGLEFLRGISAKLLSSKDADRQVQADLTPTTQALLNYALASAVAPAGAASNVAKAAGSAKDTAAAADIASDIIDKPIPPHSIEESINKLLSEAGGLATKAKQGQLSSEHVEQALDLTRRLEAVANNLLKYAEFSVVTDNQGQMLLANGAFTKLFAQPYGLTVASGQESTENETIKARKLFESSWITLLNAAPLGHSTVQSPLPGMPFQEWDLRRTLIQEESTPSRHGVLNVLRGKGVPSVSAGVNQKIAELLPSLSLYAASFGIGDEEGGAANGSRLERLVEDLEQIVSEPQKGETGWATKLQEQNLLLPPKMMT